MRFHWGLAVGHLYSHGPSQTTLGDQGAPTQGAGSEPSSESSDEEDVLPPDNAHHQPLVDEDFGDQEDDPTVLREAELLAELAERSFGIDDGERPSFLEEEIDEAHDWAVYG